MATRSASSDAGERAPLIRVESVWKRYGRKRVLRDLSLQVAAGEVVALLGANGAGKTTLLRLIAGLERPDRGEVWLEQVPLRRAGHRVRRYVGVVSHAPLLYEGLSGWENLHFYARMYDLAQPEARIEAVLRAVDLWTRRADAVRTYSRGMTQRLAIGRAILHDPPVLLLDEPDTGLDQASVGILGDLVAALRGSRRAVLLTTHHLERALAWADRLAVLRDGSIASTAASAGLDADAVRRLYGADDALDSAVDGREPRPQPLEAANSCGR